ncbi:hypothetical protein KKC44_00025 [Patescibacteria group bacterium]|nr:hypothetical protein [Patescibacteria group bacterium]MBU2258975.1 hypothetical protein [Patescibacteria group bacterium]
MYKFLLPFFALAFLLTACGGGGSAKVECETDFWNGTVGTCLPAGWITMDRETLRQRGVPDETVAAFRSEESVSGQFPSVTVTQEPLAAKISAQDYSEASVRSVSVLPGYTLIDSPSVKIDGKEVTLHIFSAQPVEDEPARRFYQVSTIAGDTGYTVTAAAPLFVENDLENAIRFILMSATFEAPAEEE